MVTNENRCTTPTSLQPRDNGLRMSDHTIVEPKVHVRNIEIPGHVISLYACSAMHDGMNDGSGHTLSKPPRAKSCPEGPQRAILMPSAGSEYALYDARQLPSRAWMNML